ncbi:hypothetical protein R4227_18630 [Gordonia amicalis]|uniref:hypothetical protein n=1 Tax=Gordonia amicalis TaxID=89053 RepID=UPI0029538609|nr:hypothetical protein [Gordonia amicalis]MDV7102078.1 hypothetical protein [Gordonia amicalis]
MTRSRRTQPRRPYRRNADRRIRITDDRRDPPDRIRLARALLQHARDLEAAQAEADARSHDCPDAAPRQTENLSQEAEDPS